MNELLFESFQVPKLTYGVDGLFSLYLNQPDYETCTAMIISFGFHTVHFLPIIKGKLDAENIRRLNVGGFHLTNFLHRGLQLKYSAHANNIVRAFLLYIQLEIFVIFVTFFQTIGRAEEIISDHCFVAKEFGPQLKLWADPDYYRKEVRQSIDLLKTFRLEIFNAIVIFTFLRFIECNCHLP